MPDILVETRGSWLEGRQTEFLHAVHQAVVQAFGTPADEPLARLIEHPIGNYLMPRSAGPRFTRVEIVLFAGRSFQAKRTLYKAVVAKLHAFEVPPDDVKVVLIEVTPEDVGFRGGCAACDVDLGYMLQV